MELTAEQIEIIALTVRFAIEDAKEDTEIGRTFRGAYRAADDREYFSAGEKDFKTLVRRVYVAMYVGECPRSITLDPHGFVTAHSE